MKPKNDMSDLQFYKANEKPYGVFSNLAPYPVEFEGKTFPTAEHAYQYGKPRKEAVRDWLMAAPTPALLAKAAHQINSPWEVAPDWSKVKVERMGAVLRAKFEQHAELRKLLLSTGARRLVEAGTVDDAAGRYWGEVRGKGKNTLGVLLMELRTALRVADAMKHQ